MLSVWGKGSGSKALARALGVKRNIRRADKVIRWKSLEVLGQPTKEFNSTSAIRLASHKYNSLKAIEQAGVKVPPCSTRLADLTKDRFNGIILAREFYHTKGEDISIGEFENGNFKGTSWYDIHHQPVDPDNAEYYIKYLKPRGEYRYHVAFGKVILATKKILAEGAVDDSLIRNHQDGKWKQVVCTETEKFSEACIKAVVALGLDFGAVDFINVKGEPYILEINTAPGLEVENRLEAYKKAFLENMRG